MAFLLIMLFKMDELVFEFYPGFLTPWKATADSPAMPAIESQSLFPLSYLFFTLSAYLLHPSGW